MSLDEVLDTEKVPTSKHKYLGIEVEFVTEADESDIIELLLKNNLAHNCYLGHDGSIDEFIATGKKVKEATSYNDETGEYDYDFVDEEIDVNGFELRILCTEAELVSVMKKVGLVFKQIKAQVNESCGLHVHLDMRNRSFVKCAKNLLLKQDEMFKMVPEHRKTNEYCRRNNVDLTGLKGPDKYGMVTSKAGRAAVNINAYNEHKTVEIRLHEGTTNWMEIVNWSKYLISVCDNKKQSKGVKEYAKKRIKAFGKKAS